MQQWLLVFDSTHHAIAAEHWLKVAALPAMAFQVVPTPRQITASCGLSLLFSGGKGLHEGLRLLANHDVQWAGLYRSTEDGPVQWIRVEEAF